MYTNILRRLFRSGELLKGCTFSRDISSSKHLEQLIKWSRVAFNGISADLEQLPQDTTPREFSTELKDSIETWRKDSKKAMWVRVPVDKSHLIPAAFKNGLEFHHVEKNYVMLFRWLPEKLECKVPVYATHHVGVSGLVLDESSCKALLVQDKKKYKIGTSRKSFWKCPGGLSDEGENIGSTAEREIFEETGVKSEFQSVLLFRQHHEMKATFNKSDIYLVCRMKPITHDIILCNDEILACEWMHLNDIITHPDTTPLTKLAAKLAVNGMKYGFQHFDITATALRSWLDPSKTFFIYHRTLENVDALSEMSKINAAGG